MASRAHRDARGLHRASRGGRRAVVGALAVLGVTAGCGLFGPDERGEETPVLDVGVGDCLLAPELDSEIGALRVVDCSEPHEQEVYAVEPFVGADGATPEDYPGEAALTAFAEGRCLELFAEYVGVDYRDSSLFFTYLLPSPRGWQGAGQEADRSVMCVVTTTGDQLTASVRDAGI
nr:septum formation family protein [uncultured Actinotalea sp.]